MESQGLRGGLSAAWRRGEPGGGSDRRAATVSTREAAAALGVSEQAVRQAIARGALAAARQGRAYRIRRDELDRYAQRRMRPVALEPRSALVALPRPAVATTLPMPATRFVGRDAELAALIALLADASERVVTVTGPGGVGKTRLALAAAAMARDGFPDGVHFVDLAPIVRPELVIPAIAQAVGLREQTGRDQRARLAAFLAGKRVLLVLDNFEQVLEAAPDVAWLVARAPLASVLVTSRAPLRIGGERVAPAPPLALPAAATAGAVLASEAGRLFVARAREHDPAFAVDAESAPAIAEICARLDGLPLAIELAAARCKVLPPRHLRDRLEPRLPLLTRGLREAPGRQRTMRDAIAWSYDLLPPDDQRRFRRLAVFAGGCTLEAAAAVLWLEDAGRGDDRAAAALEPIEALLEQSLLARERGPDGEPRFRMLETIREFGLERLAADGAEEAAVRAAHAQYFLRFARILRPLALRLPPRATFDRLAADAANVRAATAWLDDHGAADDLAGMVAACYLFWYEAGLLRETETWLERALARLGRAPSIERGRLLNGRAELLTVRGESEQAQAVFAEAIAILRGADATADLTLALIAYGATLNFGGNYQAGEAVLGEALALAESIADETQRTVITGDALANYSNSARGLGHLDLAAARSEGALRRYAGQGFELAELRTLTSLGHIARDQGRYALAVERYQRSIERVVQIGEMRLIAGHLEGIATAAAAWGQTGAALLLFGAAAALRERAGVPMRLPVDSVRVEADMERLRAAMDERTFAAAVAEGRALPLADAIAVAAAVGPPDGGPPVSSPASHEPLTRREREILGLLAESLTDREIGEALFLSPRTVNWHVRGILAKLGVASRREAAARARNEGWLPSR